MRNVSKAAHASFEAALGLDPTYAAAHLNLSFLYASGGDLEKAKMEMALAAKYDKKINNLVWSYGNEI